MQIVESLQDTISWHRHQGNGRLYHVGSPSSKGGHRDTSSAVQGTDFSLIKDYQRCCIKKIATIGLVQDANSLASISAAAYSAIYNQR